MTNMRSTDKVVRTMESNVQTWHISVVTSPITIGGK